MLADQRLGCITISSIYAAKLPIRNQNLTTLRYKKQYTSGTVPSFYRFRSITLNPLYDDTFS